MLPPQTSVPPAIQLLRWMVNPAPVLEGAQNRLGDIFTLRMAEVPDFVVLANPDTIRDVFADGGDAMHAGKANSVLKPFLGDFSVLMLDGAEHMRQRKLLLPPFRGERLIAYGDTMIDTTLRTIASWPDNDVIALHPSFQEITLDVIIRTVFGIDNDARIKVIAEELKRILEMATNPFMLVPRLQIDAGRWSPWGRFQAELKRADELLYSIISERRTNVTEGHTDILSLLLAARDDAGNPMSDRELRDELVTLLVAGHETTATALAWTFRWLLAHRELTRTLQDEVEQSLVRGRLVPETIQHLPLLDAVVREALRLLPVIPMVGRVLQEPRQIEGYDLPEGTIVAPSIYLVHRRLGVYDNPARFRPGRFLDHKFTPQEWFPFGGGVRRCIGMGFALFEMKMVVAAILARRSLELVDHSTPKIRRRAVTLTPKGGVRVRTRRRSTTDSGAN